MAAQFEKEMQYLVDTYKCEWREVLKTLSYKSTFQKPLSTRPSPIKPLSLLSCAIKKDAAGMEKRSLTNFEHQTLNIKHKHHGK